MLSAVTTATKTTTLSYKTDHAFWELFCRKTKNWGVGPMRTITDDPKVEARAEAKAQDIYARYKNHEANIPSPRGLTPQQIKQLFGGSDNQNP